MEEKKTSKGIEALKAYRENMTEEEKKTMHEKGALTRRKNSYKKRKIGKALEDLLETDFLTSDLKGNAVTLKGKDAIALNLMKSALKEDGKQVVPAFIAIRDTVGEKPTNKVDVEGTLGIENYLKPIESEDEY